MQQLSPPRQRNLQLLDARAAEHYERVAGPLRQRLEDVQSRINRLRSLMLSTSEAPARRFMARDITALLTEQAVLLTQWVDVQDQICSRYPGSPNIEYFEPGEPADTSWVRPNRIYLDV